ncbi:MAG: ABC transporter ATP-binding protein [Pseudomonadota bacterium]
MLDTSVSEGLKVSGLTKTYVNGVAALEGVDLDVAPGLYGLLGPNGAGKSTLMRTLATLQQPDNGNISLDNVDILDQPDHMRQRLGYLPQQIGSYPSASALSLLMRFAWLKGITDKAQRKQHVYELLERVNLLDSCERSVATYSGGMLRRFGIALAMIGKPRLLIVDEPTAGLDPEERKRFHNVLADLGEDAIVLLSTHIVEDVENLCTKLSILYSGKIIAEGTPERLNSQLEGRLWYRELDRNEALPDNVLHYTVSPHGKRVVAAGECPEGFSACKPKLEDVYHHAIAEARGA